ncbi:pyridoxal phosphate-dependent aminotransferase [Clostridium sp. MSJ-11]|uniref:Pyridoxal phosphate-dependent aminotransferase n=1 Tax=Clostridium mobile TaxID=2841512 RepID=A0ABS6EH83_9CLOT|nr:MalY/PatB family protein [Clostridium mobile]MBU5483835.1 pyridoxal phosphate-dependent aminotransferase [Clostridium mobile]
MKYNFDEIIDRRNTDCVKWDHDKIEGSNNDLIQMWIADMDFKVPMEVIESIKARADHGIFGYTNFNDQYFNSIMNWMKKHHSFDISKEWIVSTSTIVSALYWIVQTYTSVGDKIIIQTPVYHRFKGAIEDNHRVILENPLKEVDGRYYMDFEDLESKIDSTVKMIILCNPHNPIGRVWTKEELTRLGEICLKNNILVVADEIHCDLVFKGYKHIPFASICKEFEENSITCIAPTKTFNLAGLHMSNIVIPNSELREKFNLTLKLNAMGSINIFGMMALIAAYEKGETWYEEMMEYIEGNYNYLKDYIDENIPKLKVTKAEGTYLAWIDFKALGMSEEKLNKFLIEEGKIVLNEGSVFGKNGEGFGRMNFACSRKILEEALNSLNKAINNI